METDGVKAVKIFFCYANEDETLRAQLEKHLSSLRRLRQITGWFDRDIHAGVAWAHEIETRIDEASIILLLISPNFMYADYCYSIEMTRALDRHKSGEAHVIPIIMRPVDWEDTPIKELQVLPVGGKPITQWSNRDVAFLEVVREIRELVRTLLSKQVLSLQETTILYPEQVMLAQTQSVLPSQKSLMLPKPSDKSVSIIGTPPLSTQSSTPLITMSHQTGRHLMLAGNHQVVRILLEIGLTALEITPPETKVRRPLNVALVINHSRSMKGVKLKEAKEAIKMVLDRLEPSDYISVVIFDDSAQVIIPSMPANDPIGMKAIINRISCTGGTKMSQGIIQGMGELRRWDIPKAIRCMILLTDGITDGDVNSCYQLAKDAAAADICIYSLGFGSEEKRFLLDSIGRFGNGRPAEFIHDLSRVKRVLQIIMDQQPEQVIKVSNAHRVMLTLHLPAWVSLNQVIKILPLFHELDLPDSSSKSVTIQLGNLEKDTLILILVELIVDPRPSGPSSLAQAEISYDIPEIGTVDERVAIDIKANFS